MTLLTSEYTPFHIACELKNKAFISLLLENGYA
jgi:ankyrin repeat protein